MQVWYTRQICRVYRDVDERALMRGERVDRQTWHGAERPEHIADDTRAATTCSNASRCVSFERMTAYY